MGFFFENLNDGLSAIICLQSETMKHESVTSSEALEQSLPALFVQQDP